MNIVVIGTGYVGLVSGACFSEFGFNVTCIDKDVEKIDRLKVGEIPIYEPGLEGLVARNYQAGRLKFATTLADNVCHADVVFIAVAPYPARRWPCRSKLCFCSRQGSCRRAIRLHCHYYQIHGSGWYRPASGRGGKSGESRG